MKPASARVDSRRTLAIVFAFGGIFSVALALWLWYATGPFPIDTVNYLTTGVRLNAGEPFYAAVQHPQGYAQVALFSPPLMGVLMRPFALLPSDLAIPIWVGLMACCEFAAIGRLLRRAPTFTGLAMIVLSPCIALTVVVGNVDAFVLLSIVLAWDAIERRRDRTAGSLLGVVASLKLTPAILLWSLLVQGRRRAVGTAIGVSALLAVVAIVGSEPLIFVRFVEVTLTNYGASAGPLSLATIGSGLGLPAGMAVWLPRLALVAGFVGVLLLRRHPRGAFAVGIATMFLASPVAAFHTPALLLGMLAPIRERAPQLATSRARTTRPPGVVDPALTFPTPEPS